MARTLPIRLRTIAAAVVVIASGLIIWNAYQSIIGSSDVTNATLPIIKADTEPFRVLPDNPGGAEIPNQGSTLYNVLKSENADEMALDGVNIPASDEKEPITIFEDAPTMTTGFELPEIPEKRTESLYGVLAELEQKSEVADVQEIDIVEMAGEEKTELKEKLKAAIEKVEEKLPEPLIPNEVSKPQVTTQEESDKNVIIVVKPSKKPPYTKSVQKTAPAKKEFSLDAVLSTPPTKERHYIQLASLRGEELARTTYAKIRDNFPRLVEGLSVSFPQVDLGARGIFTRIQIGPMDAAEARSRCAQYTTSPKGGTCLVISR